MSIIKDVVPMNVDHIRREEPSTPSKDPLSSPAVHIQWQNSQSACAAMAELRAASTVPRRPPKRLTFDFELPASAAGPSSSTTVTTVTSSDPFLPSRARSTLNVRPRALGHVQSHSQNDVAATPSADASKFLDMLGRASARVDENSRKRMRVARSARTLRSPLKGKERVRAAAGTRSLDELHDHTNLVDSEHRASASGAHYSSLPIMPPNISQSQAVGDATLTDTEADDVSVLNIDPDPSAGAVDITGGSSSRAKNVTRPVPPRSLTTEHSQGRPRPSSPTLVRPVPTNLRPPLQPALQQKPVEAVVTSAKPMLPSLTPLVSACSKPDTTTPTRPPPTDVEAGAAAKKIAGGSAALMTPESLPRRGAPVSKTTNVSTIAASQSLLSSSQGPRRALGMTRTASASSSSSVRHTASVKRPFRPPRVQVPTKSQSQQWQQKDAKGSEASDPDSSFDLAFDFDPEALEAAMRPYD